MFCGYTRENMSLCNAMFVLITRDREHLSVSFLSKIAIESDCSFIMMVSLSHLGMYN